MAAGWRRPRGRVTRRGGAAAKRRILLLVARNADACILFDSGLDGVRHTLDVLRAHCEREGRDYDTIEKTVLLGGPVVDDPDATLAKAEAYAALGVSEVQVVPDRHPVEFISRIAETLAPRLAEIG